MFKKNLLTTPYLLFDILSIGKLNNIMFVLIWVITQNILVVFNNLLDMLNMNANYTVIY